MISHTREKNMLEPLLLFLTETRSILVALTVVKVFNVKMFIKCTCFLGMRA